MSRRRAEGCLLKGRSGGAELAGSEAAVGLLNLTLVNFSDLTSSSLMPSAGGCQNYLLKMRKYFSVLVFSVGN